MPNGFSRSIGASLLEGVGAVVGGAVGTGGGVAVVTAGEAVGAAGLLTGQRPIIHEGASSFSREFLSVQDAVQACLMLASRAPNLSGQAFNVGAGEIFQVTDVIRRMMSIVGKDLKPEVRPRDENFKEIPHQWLSIAKIKEQGWQPTTPLDAGLSVAADWYRGLVTKGRAPELPMPGSDKP